MESPKRNHMIQQHPQLMTFWNIHTAREVQLDKITSLQYLHNYLRTHNQQKIALKPGENVTKHLVITLFSTKELRYDTKKPLKPTFVAARRIRSALGASKA